MIARAHEKLGPIARRVLTVAGGAAIGQGLLVAISPLLTRLFTPDEFGTFAAYTALASLFAVVACMRYELAVVLADDDEQAVTAVALCLVITLATSVIFAVAIAFGGETIARWCGAPELVEVSSLIVLAIAILGVQQALGAWASRAAAFRGLAAAKAIEGSAKAVAQVGLGIGAIAGAGLVLGDVLGRFVGVLVLGVGTWKRVLVRIVHVRWHALRSLAYRYRDFPRFSTPGVLLNSAGVQAPALLFAACYGLEVAGVFALGQRVIAMPMALVGQAAGQVHLGEAGRLAREDPRALRALFARSTRGLALVGGAPIAVVALLGPWLFGAVFGPAWIAAGEYVRVLAIAYALQFVVAPLAGTLNLLEHQRWQLAWDAGRLAAVVLAIVGSAALGHDARDAMAIYAAAASLAYLVIHGLGWLAIERRIASVAASGCARATSTARWAA